MSCLPVRDIIQQESSAPIEIRVIKKWITKGKREEICYQFVDTHGDCIEATAELRHIEHFDSVIRVHGCYRVSDYVCVGPRTYMATVDHAASLVIGRRAQFTPIPDSDIPTAYFKFATYDTLKCRIKNNRLLTDYIGRVEKNALRTTGKGQILRKTTLRDQSGNQVEITFWPEMRDLLGDNVTAGDIVAVASTAVTEYNSVIQLESTYLTTAAVNPDLPGILEHINRLRTLPPTQEKDIDERVITIAELLHTNQPTKESVKGSTNLTCEASIVQIHEERGWFYVSCSKCSSKLYPQRKGGELIFVCKDDDDVTPNFRYSVNARIADATGATDAVFFNDSMSAMLEISCDDMVTKHGQTNPKKLPPIINSITNTPWILHLAQKTVGTVVINNVTKIKTSNTDETDSQVQGISSFTPATPAPKKTTTKRTESITPDASDRRKAKKP